ncbi:MAG: class I SAM-dependent methyltransferase [Rubripirellula sp.]
MTDSSFDHYASNYEDALQHGLSVSGESSSYFADARLSCLRQLIEEQSIVTTKALDFGCGVGATTAFFLQHFDLLKLTGIDPSSESIDQAKKNFALLDSDSSCEVTYLRSDDFTPESNYDLVYCNGVFHHIPLEERCRALGTIYECLRPGGVFAFWENNPYSLPARYVMSKIPFDHDAIMVWPSQVRELMTRIGFEVVSTDYHFIFPSLLRWMRWSEKLFCKLPLGAQYLVLSIKR